MLIDEMNVSEMNAEQLGQCLDEEVAACGYAVGDCGTPGLCEDQANALEQSHGQTPTAGILRQIAALMRELGIEAW